jgi:hypothetical protein
MKIFLRKKEESNNYCKRCSPGKCGIDIWSNYVNNQLSHMKNQNKPGNQQGKQDQQKESPTGQQGKQGNQNRTGDMRNEQRSGKENEEQTNREGQETTRDVTSRTDSNVRNTDRGRIPGNESGGEDVLNESEIENQEDEDEGKGR